MDKNLEKKLILRVKITWLFVVFLGAIFVIFFASGIKLPWQAPCLLLGGFLILNIISLALIKKGKPFFAKYFQSLFEIIIISLAIFYTGSFESIFSFVYLYPIIFSAVQFSMNFGLALALFASLNYLVLISGQIYGFFQPRGMLNVEVSKVSLSENSLYFGFSVLLNKILIFIATALLSGGLSDRIRNLARHLQEKIHQINIFSDRIKNQSNILKAILKSTQDALLVIDKNCHIQEINPSACSLFGLKRDKVLGKKAIGLFGHRHFETEACRVFDHEPANFELELGKEDKKTYIVSFYPFFSLSGRPQGRVVLLKDITRLKTLDRLKTEFVSIASHQLRTPLSAMKWDLELLTNDLKGKLTDEEKEILEEVYQSNKRLIRLVEDLLDVSRIEEGRIEINPKLSSIEDIIKSVLKEKESLARASNIKLMFLKLSKEIPKIKVDPQKIRQVLENLISNALAYTKKGKVTVRLERMRIEDLLKKQRQGKKMRGYTNGYDVDKKLMGAFLTEKKKKLSSDYLLIKVSDTGIGIPKEKQKYIFKKFFRTPEAIKIKSDGSGLGLFICKAIIESSGGKIWFRSKEGKGSVFYFTLPVKK